MASSPLFCDSCGAANPTNHAFCFACGRALTENARVSTATATGMLFSQTLLKQRYRILQSIGKGGMGAVYKAEDIQLGNRLVAVKEMSQQSLYPQEVVNAADSFKREAHLLAGLHHLNLPSIYDYFDEAQRWYLVMSFIEGQTLEDYLATKKSGRLAVEEVLQIGIELCTVLDYLHTHQPPIIFRDLKPSNIMRTPTGHIYLIDFGIARHFKPGQAKDTANYGSAGYAPPEQYGKTQTTPRSDIYSLGATLYHLLSGYDPSNSPFHFPSLQSSTSAIPARLAVLIERMLDSDVEQRPASMKVVKQELEQIVVDTRQTALKPASGSSQHIAPTQLATPSQFPVSKKSDAQGVKTSTSSPNKSQSSVGQGIVSAIGVVADEYIQYRKREQARKRRQAIVKAFIWFIILTVAGPLFFLFVVHGGRYLTNGELLLAIAIAVILSIAIFKQLSK